MAYPQVERMKALGWPAAIVIGITIILIELLPVVFGTGENAALDWSFLYVTFRFILLPLACLVHVAANLWLLVFNRKQPVQGRLVRFSSIVIPVVFLVFSYVYPLPLFNRFL
jgi:hypothetical protein